MTEAAPLRFLALVVGGWICIRAALLAPGWRDEADPAVAVAPAALAAAIAPPMPAAPNADPIAARTQSSLPRSIADPLPTAAGRSFSRPRPSADRERGIIAARLPSRETDETAPVPDSAAPVAAPSSVRAPARPHRLRGWSGSAWAVVRAESGGPALAPGGTLGGSQAGLRLLYRLRGGLALSGRLYAPLGRARGAEAAAGLEWRPSARLPVHLLAERRQALGREGRSAFALSLHGGASRDLPHGLRIDAYGQAGLVGTRSRDLFADGSLRVSAPFGPVEMGAGAWGAAQPGLSRVDAGPSISYRLPVRGAALRLQAEWRFRLAGDAAPGSGPALTLAADF